MVLTVRGLVFLTVTLSLFLRSNIVSLDLLAPYPIIALPTVPQTSQ